MTEFFCERLEKARILAGFKSPRAAAEANGWNPNTYKSHESGIRAKERPPASEVVRKYARAFRVDYTWLLTGQGQPRSPVVGSFDPDAPDDAQPDENMAISTEGRHNLTPGAVPEHDLRAGASYGGGYVQGSQVTGKNGQSFAAESVKAEWIIPLSFLQGELRLAVGTTDILPIDGPSMLPDLAPGDRVMIDRSHRDPRQGGIFAVREGDGIIIKHVEIIRGSEPLKIKCSSSNPSYHPFELILDGDQVSIIGRVAGRITRM